MLTRTRSPRRGRTPHVPRTHAHAATVLAASLLLASVAGAQAPGSQPPAAQPAAGAQPAAAAQPAGPSEAQLYFEQGVAALRAGNHQLAADLLNKSYALEQYAATLYDLGIAYQALRSPALAVEAWEAYLSMADPKQDAQTIAAVKREIGRVTGLMARFQLKVDPADASIMIDGTPARLFKGELWLHPGSRRIAVRAPGYEDFEQTLVVQAGRFSLDIKLRRPQGAPGQVAARLLSEGEALVNGGNTADGVAKLEQSYKLAPTPHTAGALALAAETMGRLGEAQEMVDVALADRNDPWVKEHKRQLRLTKRRLVGKTATLYILGAEYPGAEVEVNGRIVGKLPLPDGGKMKIAEGPLAVKAHLAGHDSYSMNVEVKAQTEVRVNVLLYKSKEIPVSVVLVPIANWPAPPPPPPTPVAAPEPAPKAPEEEGARQEDIEALAEGYTGEPPEEHKDVVGFEMQTDIGYQFWLGDGLSDSSGGFGGRLFGFGFRPFWLVSFGLQVIAGQFDLPGDERQVVASMVTGGLYLRLHSQQKRKAMTPDFWGGVGFQPISMNLSVYKAKKLSAQDATAGTTAGDVAQNELGVGDTVTLQTMNVPLELGFTWYFTEGVGVSINGQYTFWIPSQECFHDASDRLCYESGLTTLKSMYVGVGLNFLP